MSAQKIKIGELKSKKSVGFTIEMEVLKTILPSEYLWLIEIDTPTNKPLKQKQPKK